MYIHSLKSGKRVLIGKIEKLKIGKYAFATKSALKNDYFTINANMPLFDTKEQAEKWIATQPQWEIG